LLAFVTMLIALAWSAVVAAGSSETLASCSTGAAAVDALESAGDERETPPPLPPTDVDDDDDDDNDDQEVFTHEAHFVATRMPIARSATQSDETLRPSLGHPRGIDDPPRS
jgi:hypothetical protein